MVYFFKTPLYPIILSLRGWTNILYYKSILFPQENPILISLSLLVQVWGPSILCPHPATPNSSLASLINRSEITELKWSSLQRLLT